MRILYCHIENFGKLHDLDLDFGSEIHTFHHQNGWGKSTLAAFLVAMFYGLGGERKKNVKENDRKKYQPWQGGVFGGSLLFQVGERQYTVNRIFADKESRDEFELRDAETNKLCADYSENLGEELFGVNRESFLRTACINQNDCRTQVTDDIQAKIGSRTQVDQDLARYDSARKALDDLLNQMNPNRSTGSIFRRAREISSLSLEVQQGQQFGDLIARCEAELLQEEMKAAASQAQLVITNTALEKAARNQSVLARQETWLHLTREKTEKEAEVRKTRSFFPDKVPDLEIIGEKLRECRELNNARNSMHNFCLTEEEERLLAQKRKAAGAASQKKGRRKQNSRLPLLLILTGFLILLAALLPAGRQLAGDSFTGICIFLGGAGILVGLAAWFIDQSKEVIFSDDVLYHSLLQKKENYEDAKADYREYDRDLTRFLSGFGFAAEKDLTGQLLNLRDRVDDYLDAVRDLARVRGELEGLESGLSEEEKETLWTEGSHTLTQLTGETNRLSEAIRQSEKKISMYRHHLDQLKESYEEWQEKKETLQELLREQEEEQEKYRYVSLARKGLAKAKEARTLRYSGTLRKSFTSYYEIITGERADHIFFDADSRITIQEYGRQRDTEAFSQGYQDLYGLCMRLALVDAMYEKEGPVLILDDPLVNLDSEKQKRAERLLRELSQKYQILFFTCRSFMQDSGDGSL